MPGVEELESEPRNVPQRPLKREAKRGGRARGKRRARDSDVSCAAQSLAMFISGEEDGSGGGGQYFILVSLIHSLNLPSTSTHPPTPPQALWQRSGSGFARLLSFPPAASLCHILCLVSALIYGPTGSGVHV